MLGNGPPKIKIESVRVKLHLAKGISGKNALENSWKHLVHFSVWLPISTFSAGFMFIFWYLLSSEKSYDQLASTWVITYYPNIKTLLQLEKPWWKPTRPQLLVPRHMLSGTARSEGVAKLRAKNGALFQASGSEQVEWMIRVFQNTKAWGPACNLQNHRFQLKSHLQRGSRLRKKWMKTTLPIPVFRFHVRFLGLQSFSQWWNSLLDC